MSLRPMSWTATPSRGQRQLLRLVIQVLFALPGATPSLYRPVCPVTLALAATSSRFGAGHFINVSATDFAK